MESKDFSISFTVDQSPKQIFEAVTNVRGWWSQQIDGSTQKLNDQFDYHYLDVHRCKIKLIEVVPDKKIVWDVLENYFKFTKDHAEWTGTKVIFDITEKNGQTQLNFTHQGLNPDYECYEICSNAWTTYIQKSLRSLIETGTGFPNNDATPQTENVKKLAAQQ